MADERVQRRLAPKQAHPGTSNFLYATSNSGIKAIYEVT